MVDVITIGSATYDVFLRSSDFKVITTNKFPSGKGECLAFGSKIGIRDMETAIGGGATNVAASLKQLGARVKVASRIGNDLFGDEVLDDLRARRIPTDLITRDTQHKTAHSTILVMPHGDRTVLVYRGASENVTDKDISWQSLQATWLYISSLRREMALHRKIFTHAKKKKQFIMWNPGGQELSNSRKSLAWFLKRADVLLLNEEEARRLTGRVTASRKKLLEALDHISPGMNIITAAEKGSFVSTGDDHFYVKVKRVKVVNATGAGDAFGAGFLAGLIESNDPREAAKVGTLNSAGVIQVSGAKAGILSKYPSQQQLNKIDLSVY